MNKTIVSLYIPKLDDYWYQEKIQADALTMSYNAGYDVTYFGYHYDTGCIDFPKDKWEDVYNTRISEKKYFTYIKDEIINEFVGYVYYHYDKNNKRYECGVLIEYKYRGMGYAKKALELLCEEARGNGIKSLYDNFEIDRGNTLKLFESVGFEIVDNLVWKKFKKNVNGVLVKIDLQL